MTTVDYNGKPAKLTYLIFNKAWYADAARLKSDKHTDEVLIQFEAEGDGVHGEFSVCWYTIGRMPGDPTPRLEVYGDAFAVLGWLCKHKGFHRLLARFNDDQNDEDSRLMTVSEFVSLLESMGFTDVTQRERPEYLKQERPRLCT